MTVVKPWMRATLGSIVLVCALVGASFGVYALTAPPTPASAKPAAKTTQPPATTTTTGEAVHLTQPATLNGLSPNTDPTLAPVLAAITGQMSTLAPNATQKVKAAYGDLGDRSLVILGAFAAPDPDPAALLDSAMSQFKGQLGMTQTTDVDPGPLGGVAQCGDGSANGAPIAVCSWADNDSFGSLAFYFQQSADVHDAFVSGRGQVETLG